MSRNPGLTSVQGTPELSKRDWPPNGVETFYANRNDDQPLQHELFDTIYQLLKDITWWPKFNPRCFLSFGVKRTRADLMYPASSGFSRPDPETICGLCPYEDLNSLTAWSFKSTDCFVSERILPIHGRTVNATTGCSSFWYVPSALLYPLSVLHLWLGNFNAHSTAVKS